MPRSKPEPITDLDHYEFDTVTLGQAADYLGLDRRAVAGLVKGGILTRKIRPAPSKNTEFHIWTWSLREFDRIKFKRTA